MIKQSAKFIAILILILNMGCNTIPSFQGTALDHMKSDLQGAIKNNKNLPLPKKVPKVVENSLKPESLMANKNNKEIKQPSQKFDVIADGVQAKAFFLGLVEDTDFNLMVHPRVAGIISLKLKNVNIMEVLEATRRIYGYGVEVENKNIRIYPAELQTRTFKVNYLDMTREGVSETKVSSSGLDVKDNDSTDTNGSTSSSSNDSSTNSSLNSKINTTSKTNFWGQLKSTLESMIGNEDGRRVSVIPMSGLVVVQAMPDELLKVEQFLKQSESVLNKQVILEAKILEVELNDAYRAGINWGLISNNLNIAQIGSNLHDEVTSVLPSSNGINPQNSNLNATGDHIAPTITSNFTPFGGIFALGTNFRRLSAFVELLGSQGNVQVLSSPRVSTTNNQKALIKIGSDEFFVTNITTTTTATTNNVTTSPSVEFDSFFSGIALDVTPQIDDSDCITLHIHPTISSVTQSEKKITINSKEQTFPLAKSTIRESDSIVRARNGQFVIIGGLMQDKTGEMITGVPFLKDLPFVGTIFRQTKQEAKKTELVILLRPYCNG